MPSGPPSASRAAALAAESEPMLVPTSHTGTRASSRIAAMACLTSAAWSEVVRKFHRPLFRSEGWSRIATRKPSRAQRTRVRTRKLPWSWPIPSAVIARLPSPPAKMITLATGVPAGRRRRNDSVTPGRAGIVRTSSSAAHAADAGERGGQEQDGDEARAHGCTG